MATKTHPESDCAALRASIERIIAHYPDISDEELHKVLHYFRRDASALDRATIASNTEIAGRYRQLCDDHKLDKLGMVETVAAAVFAVALIAAILFFTLGDWDI